MSFNDQQAVFKRCKAAVSATVTRSAGLGHPLVVARLGRCPPYGRGRQEAPAIADYASSQGRNSTTAMRVAIKELRSRTSRDIPIDRTNFHRYFAHFATSQIVTGRLIEHISNGDWTFLSWTDSAASSNSPGLEYLVNAMDEFMPRGRAGPCLGRNESSGQHFVIGWGAASDRLAALSWTSPDRPIEMRPGAKLFNGIYWEDQCRDRVGTAFGRALGVALLDMGRVDYFQRGIKADCHPDRLATLDESTEPFTGRASCSRLHIEHCAILAIFASAVVAIWPPSWLLRQLSERKRIPAGFSLIDTITGEWIIGDIFKALATYAPECRGMPDDEAFSPGLAASDPTLPRPDTRSIPRFFVEPLAPLCMVA
jgi:hypothetical protein